MASIRIASVFGCLQKMGKIKGKIHFQRCRATSGTAEVPSHASAIPLPLGCLDMAQGGPGTMNEDLKLYYLHLLSEAEPICKFTARVNRKFMFTSFQEKKAAFLS